MKELLQEILTSGEYTKRLRDIGFRGPTVLSGASPYDGHLRGGHTKIEVSLVPMVRVKKLERAKWSFNESLKARFTVHLAMMPGCCGVLVLYDANMDEPYDHLGVGATVLDAVVEVIHQEASSYRFASRILATTSRNEPYAVKYLRSRSWVSTPAGTNPRSGNQLTLWSKDVLA